MENQNQNMQSSQGGDLASLRSMFDGLKKSTEKPTKKRLSNEERLAKYFKPRREKETIRILPSINGTPNPIDFAFFHPVRVNKAGKKGFRTIYCPAHNDPKVPKLDANGKEILDQNGKPVMVTKHCPLCEKAKAIKARQDKSVLGKKPEELNEQQKAIYDKNKEIYKQSLDWEAKQFYIVRVIDRGATGEGVKFWRFKHSYRNDGIFDKLIPALDMYIEQYETNFTDVEKGADVILNVAEATMWNGKPYKQVTNIMTKGPVPLSTDPVVVKQWTSDAETWREAFPPATAPQLTTEEYLDRVAKGTDPYWDDSDSDNKRWVFPDPRDEERQVKANTRDESFVSNKSDENVAMASDIVRNSYDGVTIENVTKEDVGEFKDDAVDVSSSIQEETRTTVQTNAHVVEQESVSETQSDSSNDMDIPEDYDDLPF